MKKCDRETLVRLYITELGDSVWERISVEGIQGEGELVPPLIDWRLEHA